MRQRTSTELDRRLNQIVARSAAEIALAVRRDIADELGRLVGVGGWIAANGQRKRRIILCPVSGCGKPGGGPKWGWFCAKHKDLPAAEKERARAARRVRPRPLAAAQRRSKARRAA